MSSALVADSRVDGLDLGTLITRRINVKQIDATFFPRLGKNQRQSKPLPFDMTTAHEHGVARYRHRLFHLLILGAFSSCRHTETDLSLLIPGIKPPITGVSCMHQPKRARQNQHCEGSHLHLSRGEGRLRKGSPPRVACMHPARHGTLLPDCADQAAEVRGG